MNPHPPAAPSEIRPDQLPQPVPPEDRPDPGGERVALGVPRAYRDGNKLVIENDPALPARVCIKSGRPAAREIEVTLRDPKNPMTWFGKRPTIIVGLTRREYDNHRVAITLTWATLSVGGLLLVAGLFTAELATIIVGLLAMAGAGVFRATSPVTSPDAREGGATIHGACQEYLNQFPTE